MRLIKRLDRLEVATTDLADASSTYQRNFGLKVRPSADSDTSVLEIGDAEVRLLSGTHAAATIARIGEGMAALWLEAEDVEEVARALESAGVKPEPVRRQEGRRVLPIDRQVTNGVPLFIFDRKS